MMNSAVVPQFYEIQESNKFATTQLNECHDLLEKFREFKQTIKAEADQLLKATDELLSRNLNEKENSAVKQQINNLTDCCKSMVKTLEEKFQMEEQS